MHGRVVFPHLTPTAFASGISNTVLLILYLTVPIATGEKKKKEEKKGEKKRGGKNEKKGWVSLCLVTTEKSLAVIRGLQQ